MRLHVLFAAMFSLAVAAALYFSLSPLFVEACPPGMRVGMWRTCAPFQPVMFAVILSAITAGISWLALEYFRTPIKLRFGVSGLLFTAVLFVVILT